MLLKTLMKMHFITPYHIIHVIIYASMISYFMLMDIGSFEGITLSEFNEEEEEEEQQEIPQAIAPEEEEQTLEDLPECSDHRPTSLLKGKPRAFKPPMFYKISLESFIFDALGYKS